MADRDLEDYYELLLQMHEELKPQSDLEKVLVQRVVDCAWRLRKIIVYQPTPGDFHALRQYETSLENSLYVALDRLQELQSERQAPEALSLEKQLLQIIAGLEGAVEGGALALKSIADKYNNGRPGNLHLSAQKIGTVLWRMPIVDDLRKDIDSPFADMANTGSAEGGAITAALFLKEFVTLPWVHLDIAGTAFLRKADPFSTKGATGVMHATLVDLALDGAGRPQSHYGEVDPETPAD